MERDINDFAAKYGLDVGSLILSIIKYLVDDPRDVSSGVRNTLVSVTDGEIDGALDTIEEDLLATNDKRAIS